MTYLGLVAAFAAVPVAACGMIAHGPMRQIAGLSALALTGLSLFLM
ncbi:hypothetical protein [Paracraurococcus ruber]|nr:hypothetical protein [Paracraurococcus ruber]